MMPKNIFDSGGRERAVFRDERVLYPDFVPDRLPFRDALIQELVFALKPVVLGRKPENVFVFGSPGTGKTVTVKHVVGQLKEHSERAKPVFVNCFEQGTRHAVLAELSSALGIPVPKRGTGSSEIIERLSDFLKKTESVPVLVLDEADQLLPEGEADKLFYDILRLSEREEARLGMVFVSNDSELPARLDDRVRSSLAEKRLFFSPYTVQQLKQILSERIERAFFPNSVGEEAVALVSAFAFKNSGDARIAIECLLKAGRIAEKKNSASVSVEHAREAIGFLQPRQEQKAVPFLSEAEKKIFELLGKQELTSGQLFNIYRQNCGKEINMRSFREIVNSLASKKLVKTETISLKGRGRTRTIKKSG